MVMSFETHPLGRTDLDLADTANHQCHHRFSNKCSVLIGGKKGQPQEFLIRI